MLDYEVLCQAIVDWRAGRRASVPPPTADPRTLAAGAAYGAAAPGSVEEVDSGLLEEDEIADATEEPGDYAQGQESYDATSMYGEPPSSHDTLPGPRASDIDVDVE